MNIKRDPEESKWFEAPDKGCSPVGRLYAEKTRE